MKRFLKSKNFDGLSDKEKVSVLKDVLRNIIPLGQTAGIIAGGGERSVR